MKAHIETITNLLLGAAYADHRLHGLEIATIRNLLRKLLDTQQLPQERLAQIASFEPEHFNPEQAAASLVSLDRDDKRKVVELIALVNETDTELDVEEDEYLRTVARGMGLTAEDIKDLTLDVEEDELAQFFED